MRTVMTSACAVVVASVGTALAGPGDVLWSIQREGAGFTSRPAVGADGALYWTQGGLSRLDPGTGQVLWHRADQAGAVVAIGPDGVVYGTGSIDQGTAGAPLWHPTAIALSPSGELLWEWVYDAAYWYPEAGPTLGPDGNLYIISYGGYRQPGHLFSLTTGGAFRWEHRRFANGNGVQNLSFSGGNVMKVGQYTAIPGGPLISSSAGLVAADMESGQLSWWEAFAAGGDPLVSPVDERFCVAPGLTRQVRAYSAAHQLEWTHTVDWSPTGLNTLGMGPEGNIYVSHAVFRVMSLTPEGAVRWSVADALPASYYYAPTVSPDGSVIVYTTTGPGDTPGYVTALRTADGSVLWEVTLPGAAGGYTPVRGYGGVSFSPDSRVAYIPATSVCYCGPTGYQTLGHLFALEVGAGCRANCDGSTAAPVLNVQDFGCFLNAFAAGQPYANCDGSTVAPVLNVADFACFLNLFAAGCP